MVIITLSIALEYLPELFRTIPFRYEVPDTSGYVFDTTWKDPIWYFIQGLLCLIASIYLFISIPKKYIAANIIAIGPIIWWLVEVYQKFSWLIKLNDSRLYVDKSGVWQISIILFLIVGGFYGIIRYKS